jgi:S-formylglutathione hydrolase FrmB
MKRKHFVLLLIVLVAMGQVQASLPAAQESAAQPGLQIRFSFTEAVSTSPLNGRIIVGFHKDVSKPIHNPNPFDPQPTFAWDVRDWKPGEVLVLDSSGAESWKGDLDALDGWYGVQAVFKMNKARSAEAPGNAVTPRNVVFIEKGKMCRPLDLLFSIPVTERRKFKETEFIKEVNFSSGLLARFTGEPESIKAAVVLPPSYFQEPDRVYPSVYVMGGWGASPYDLLAPEAYQQKRYGMSGFGEEKVFIFLDLECRSGYQTFCDSDTNGPREETFFQELVPFIEKNYRVDKNPQTRFLTGQSTGAWASLWLLVQHPDQFGGAYAGSPDPVDFTEFLWTNIYEKNANMYLDSRGQKKFMNGTGLGPDPWNRLTIEDWVGLDRIAGWGEQMDSFDATFSTRDVNGELRRLFDWTTGKVDPGVAASWAGHDLSKIVSKLDRKTTALLQDKIRIFVDSSDPFGLNKPVEAFQRELVRKGLRAHIEYVSRGDHSTWNDDIRKFMHADMDRKCLAARESKAP